MIVDFGFLDGPGAGSECRIGRAVRFQPGDAFGEGSADQDFPILQHPGRVNRSIDGSPGVEASIHTAVRIESGDSLPVGDSGPDRLAANQDFPFA